MQEAILLSPRNSDPLVCCRSRDPAHIIAIEPSLVGTNKASYLWSPSVPHIWDPCLYLNKIIS